MAFSSAIAACVAAGLTAACALVLAPNRAWGQLGPLCLLAFTSTLVVYNIDRLRDLGRDRGPWPDRTAFVERSKPGLMGLVLGAAVVSAGLALQQPVGVWLVCGGVLVLGLLHRRLKGAPIWKVVYLTAAWLGVVVGLPSALDWNATDPGRLAWVAAAMAGALAANMIASNQHRLPAAAGLRHRNVALALAAGAVAVAMVGPAPARPLAAIPLALLAAIAWGGQSERARLWAIDGSLAAGALVALAIQHA